jgi:hypothetical protein
MWATTEDVTTLTGVTVTEADRNIAATVIEAKTGVLEGVKRSISDRDLYFLKQAVCYEAVFVAATPDFLERMNLASASQDGQSVTTRNADDLILAPLARMAIKRLSWRGPRGLNIGRAGAGDAQLVDSTSEAYDDSLPWRPL